MFNLFSLLMYDITNCMLWIVGKNFSGLAQYLTERNIPYGTLADMRSKTKLPADSVSIPIDFTSEHSLLESFEKNRSRHEFSALLVAGYEQYVLPAAWLSRHLHLPGPSIDAAIAATNKKAMRQQFSTFAPEITPDFQKVRNSNDITSFMANHQYPVMLKPSNLMKSLYVTKNINSSELANNYRLLETNLSAISNKHRTTQQTEIIIEEFLQGSMHTVAGYTDANGNVELHPEIVDIITAEQLGKNDNYLFSRHLPSQLSEERKKTIFTVAKRAVKALGLTSTMLHIEIIYTEAGPKIVEVGARIGGYRARMYEYACGDDMYQTAIDVAYGRTPKSFKKAHMASAFIELFPDTVGTYKGIAYDEQIERLDSLRTYSKKQHPGANVGPAKDGYRAVAVIMLGTKDTSALLKDIQNIQNKARVRVSD